MILITQFWNFEKHKRKEEIYKCLLNNANNRYISKIYVFSENNDVINFTHNKIISLTGTSKMTYYELFKVVNQNFRNQICIISNADIYFDASIVKLNQFDFTNKIIALTSYDYKTNKLESGSVDSWILKSMNIPYSEFSIGKSHDDLRLIKNLKDSDIEIINPSNEILSYHIDEHKFLKTTTAEELEYIEPTRLKEQIVLEDIEPPEKVKIIKRNVQTEPIIPSLLIKKTNKQYIDNPPININIHKTKKIAIVLHLYYQDLWEEFDEVISKLVNYNFDLYVTLTKDSTTLGQTQWIKEKIEKTHKNSKVLIVDNKGLDIGAFLMVLEHLLLNNKQYEYLLKLHTKKSLKTAGINYGSNWRKQLYSSIVGSEDILNKVFNKLSNDNIGMVGDTKWLSDYEGLNTREIKEIKEILNIKNSNKKFIGGTMFWVKYNILQKRFNKQNLRKIYNLLENNYFTDVDGGTYTHAMERVLGQMISSYGKIISGV